MWHPSSFTEWRSRRNLLPFVLGDHCAPIAIPALRGEDGAWTILDETQIRRMGFVESARRFRTINTRLKNIGKGTSLQQRIDVRFKLTKQVHGSDGFLVLSGAGGKHICAACVPITRETDLVVDQTLYWRFFLNKGQAWYWAGMLGSRAVTEAVLPFNPKGAFGERHIHALPYRVIPEYDPNNEEHRKISELTRRVSEEATQMVNGDGYLENPNKALTVRRTRLRERLWRTDAFKQLDRLCSAVLGTSAILEES